MLMMRLQRVGRKNDPSYRIVVVDKRTGPKSNKHIDHLGSYNPKLNHIQLDKEKAADWLSKGVQASDTMFNLLVSQKVVEGKKRNPLPKKSPVVDEEKLKAEAEAKEKAEAEAKATEAEVEEVAEETKEEAKEETEANETPAETEETKTEEK